MYEKAKIIAVEKAVMKGIVSPVAEKAVRARDPQLGPGYLVSVSPLNPCKQNKPESVFVSEEEINRRNWKVVDLTERRNR